jgi:hypothetical protein
MLNKRIHDRAVQVHMHGKTLSQPLQHMVLCVVWLCVSRTYALCGLSAKTLIEFGDNSGQRLNLFWR